MPDLKFFAHQGVYTGYFYADVSGFMLDAVPAHFSNFKRQKFNSIVHSKFRINPGTYEVIFGCVDNTRLLCQRMESNHFWEDVKEMIPIIKSLFNHKATCIGCNNMWKYFGEPCLDCYVYKYHPDVATSFNRLIKEVLGV